MVSGIRFRPPDRALVEKETLIHSRGIWDKPHANPIPLSPMRKSSPPLTSAGFAAVLLGAFGLMLAACTTTRLESDWVAPEVGDLKFQRLFVVAITPDFASRRRTEQALQQQITSVPVVASYEWVPDLRLDPDHTQLNAAIQQTQADGIVVLRLFSNKTEILYIPGGAMPDAYLTLQAYYSSSQSNTFTSLVSTDQVLGIETNVYRAETGSLVWSATSRSVSPANIDELIKDLLAAVRTRLKQRQLIP